MPSRLSAALRELAEALEDAEADDWTVVVDSPRATSRRSPSPKSTLQASGAAQSSTASAVLQPPPTSSRGPTSWWSACSRRSYQGGRGLSADGAGAAGERDGQLGGRPADLRDPS